MCDNETFNNTMCDTMRHLKYNVWHNETLQCNTMRNFKYNVWHNEKFQIQCVTKGKFQIQCVTQWDISNTMCDKMRNTMCDKWDIVTQWDILNTMCDNETFQIQCVTMRHFKYNVWHNETF